MKRRISQLLACCLLAFLLLLPQQAQAAGASFSGSTSLRAGDRVTVTFSVSGSNIVAIQGTLSYDSNLELTGTSQLVSSPWAMDMNGSTVVLYDNSLSHPVSNASVFSATFRVKSGVAAGTAVSASVTGITVSDGSSDTSLGSASWSATIAAPLSSNAKLSSLSCSSGSLSPSFSADTTSYSVTVPYSVTSLSLSYNTQDSGAKVSVSGNSLSVGSNTVTLTVTAPNGNTKSYVIRATRQQDPNYVPSSNALLASLSPSSGKLSPAFDPEVKEYVVYLPYETEQLELSGVAQDGKARSVTGSSADLEPGDNPLTVVCVAEDGSTTAEYTVHAYRMPAYEGILPQIIGLDFADYTAVDEALAKVPADLTVYTDESANALQKAVDAVVRDYPADKQRQVDDMAKAIEAALAALEEKVEPVDTPEDDPTIWQRLAVMGGEAVTIPYLSDLTGPLPLWSIGLAALILLLLLAYLIGTLIGRAVGKRRTLRRIRKEQEAAQLEGVTAPIVPGVAGDEVWELSAEKAEAPTAAEPAAEAAEDPAPQSAEPEAPVQEEPAPAPVEPEAPVVEEPVPETVEPEASVVEEPVPETVEPEAPVVEEPVPETVEPEAPVVEEPVPETIEPEAPVVEEPVPETVEPEAPTAEEPTPAPAADLAADELEETIRHMSLDDLLDDIRNM